MAACPRWKLSDPDSLEAVVVGLALARPSAQRGGQPETVGRLGQQRRPSVATIPGAAGDIEAPSRDATWLLHLQGALLG
jgi:hypothetical protein